MTEPMPPGDLPADTDTDKALASDDAIEALRNQALIDGYVKISNKQLDSIILRLQQASWVAAREGYKVEALVRYRDALKDTHRKAVEEARKAFGEVDLDLIYGAVINDIESLLSPPVVQPYPGKLD